ncbi:integrin beta-3-like isoform X1 [Diadema antillarum]|uniref:integrin beta-3-like isoform X1 n=1 Tax=Diadema antillarum TaxID=105358 RepID=UPI003A857A78
MQAAVCKEAIGWRDSSRHIVLYASDALYHSAGDGRLGGIVTPNDGVCHLNTDTGYYDFDQQMDYPSLGHLAQKIRDQSIIVMFIVTEDVEAEYRSLLPHIQGSQIGQLAADSSNILFWIERLYNKITSVVELNVDVGDELLLEFTSNCLNGVSTPDSMICDGLTIGDTVSFSIDVTAESCVPGGSTSFTVSPVGFSEAMTVNVEIDCDCDCELEGVLNSPRCNGNGTFACGQCACNPGRYGDFCQCSGETATVGDDRAACMAPTSNLICSGRGECVCGECVCDKQSDPTHVVSGRYCQCDNFNCPLYDGQLCGGPARGRCECDMATQQSKCVCTSSYTGDSCNCLRSQEPCRAPNGLICNAHGTCDCGSCRCEADSPFKGATCFDCATCSGQCEVYQECVQCKAFNTGPLTEQQCSMCVAEVIIVKSFPDVSYEYNCSVPHTDNCSIVFVPYFANGTADVPTLYVLEEEVCPLVVPYRVDARWVAVGLAVAIVLIGILFIIIYKCYITYLDRKEYEEWERDKKNAQFSSVSYPTHPLPFPLALPIPTVYLAFLCTSLVPLPRHCSYRLLSRTSNLQT